MQKKISLNGSWNLWFCDAGKGEVLTLSDRAQAQKIGAQVPGNADLDLSKAGYLPEDLFKGMNTVEAYKTETYDYLYEREFDFAGVLPGEKVSLTFDGVDCLAEYYLNGEKFGESGNMFISHSFEVSPKAGKNTLTVIIRSAVLWQDEKEYPAYLFAGWHVGGGVWLRKPAHSFGWDIFPRAVTAGIWKDVTLTVTSGYEVEDHGYIFNTENLECPSIRAWFTFKAPYREFMSGDLEAVFTGSCGDSSFEARQNMNYFKSKSGCLNVSLPDPKLWWPAGYGEANLYDVKLALLKNGAEVASVTDRIGIRDLKLERTDSLTEEGHCFRFRVNGEIIECKGSNWVPLDAYHSRDKERYAKALELVEDIGCNILRIWGGGVYEQDCFYDWCDAHGILIWQDFMMACQICPMEPEFEEELKKEFTQVVRRLRHHPSIALWSGDNEIDESMASNGYNPENNELTRRLIPEVLKREDFQRPYLPSSPYLPGSVWEDYRKGKDVFVERHLWGARDYFKADFYKNSQAHFVSETGYHGCPNKVSLEKMVTEQALWPIFNEEWTLHSSDQRGSDHRVHLMMDQVKQLFGFEPDNLDDFILASQISQAEAKKYFIERIRAGKPSRSGVIWWNLLDGWPQMSDAVVDYYYEKKLAYSFIKRAQAPFSIFVDEMHDWNYTLIAGNDSMETRKGEYRVEDILSGEVLCEGKFEVEPNSNRTLAKIRLMYSDKKMLLITWKQNGVEGFNHYLCGMPGFDFDWYRSCLAKLQEYENK